MLSAEQPRNRADSQREINYAENHSGAGTARPKISEIFGRAVRTKNLENFRASSFSEEL